MTRMKICIVALFATILLDFIYCRSGSRSRSAVKTMENLSFTKVYNFKSGINEWKQKGYALER